MAIHIEQSWSQEEGTKEFKSGSAVIMAADAALAAASKQLHDVTVDSWIRQKLIKAALEAALASVIDSPS
ncbi:hypothetical protein [Pantoea eucrina]|uniref:hypothetical protein n=1 Tax=Pantoea eucrina TaxID=472693 RepID=UPI000D3FA197|nr:hypothetical protein [Pantoea eucrina]PPS58845.1 hypothetical protein CRX72_23915 [Pantoea sp. BRM17]UBB12388.1 hypothetical protein LAC65_11180 [Pantoea eucrina]